MGRFMNNLRRWADGSPPITEDVYRYVYQNFSLLFVFSSWFPDLRPKFRVLSTIFGILYAICTFGYVVLYLITVYKQKSDLAAASLSAQILIVHFLTFTITVLINCKRHYMMCLFRAMLEDFFNYGDDEDISEMGEELRKTRKQKIFVLIAQPVYIFMTAVVALSRRNIDSYVGIEESSYVGDIYMLTPVPCWYPFRITNDFLHYATSWSQIITASMNASFFCALTGGQIIFMQSLGLQLKVLKYRIRKLELFTYRRLKKEGRKVLKRDEVFQDPKFLNLFNKNLNLCAEHHVTIIKNFYHLQEVLKWPLLVGVMILSVMICVSLLLILVAGKPSDVAFGGILLFDELLNLGMMCWQTEQVKELGSSLHEELYDINWSGLDTRAKRTLMIMIERTKKPLVLKDPIINTPLTWETYCKVYNTAYSYVNILSAAFQQSNEEGN